ncbi:MAG: hypothetical protein ACREGC_01265 [Minisyncoccia bacterium]
MENLKQIPMRTWLITDTHFGHDKMVQYCGRPTNFANIIFHNLTVNLKYDDLLIHLGDFCIGNDSYWHNWFCHSLPGKKWLVRGNHDRKTNNFYLSRGWDFVSTNFMDTLFGQRILFSHIPTAKTPDWDINIHGHLHNSTHHPEVDSILSPHHKLFAIEYTNYQPVLLDKFLHEPKKT